jgi:hypothetical protein
MAQQELAMLKKLLKKFKKSRENTATPSVVVQTKDQGASDISINSEETEGVQASYS